MFENVDEFLLCSSYVGILALVLGRLDSQAGYSRKVAMARLTMKFMFYK